MNDTTLQAYALEKGISKSTTEMTNQEKIGLAMEMFMEKTAYAAGNYAKENETLAGSLGTAKAALTNFLDGSGDVEQLVTAFKNAADVIVKNVTEIAPRLVTGITDIINQVIPMIPPLSQELLPIIITGAVNLLNGVISALPTIVDMLVNEAIPKLLTGLVSILEALISQLPTLMQSVISAIVSTLPVWIDALVSLILTLCTYLPQGIQPLIDNLPMILETILSALLSNLPVLVEGLINLIVALIPMIPELLLILLDVLLSVFPELWTKTLLDLLPVLLVGLVQLVWELVKALPGLLLALVEVIFMPFILGWNALKTLFNEIAPWFDTYVIQPVLKFFQSLWEGMKVVWDGICNAVKFAIDLIASILSAAFQIITLPFRFIWENCKETVMAVWDAIKEKISTAINTIKSVITIVFDAVKTYFTNVFNAYKTIIMTVFNAVKEYITNVLTVYKTIFTTVWNAIKTTISNAVNGIKTTISTVFNSVKNTVSTIFNSIKEKMTTPIEKARDLIKGIVDKIKGFFSGMKISFPNIKLPHFSIKPKGWEIGDLLKGKIPSLGIDWYAKAMNSPMIMNKPTIFGYDPKSGNMQAGGEAGSEMVGGVSAIMNMISAAVASQMGDVSYYLQKLIEMLAEYFPEILEAMDRPISFDPEAGAAAMAIPMNKQLGIIKKREERGR